MYIYLLFIITIIILYFTLYSIEYFSEYNRQEDYKFYNVDINELKSCGIIKDDNKIKNWENRDDIFNIIIPDLLQRLNSEEYKSNPRYYYSELYFARKGKTNIENIDIIIDLINQYMECVFVKNKLYVS